MNNILTNNNYHNHNFITRKNLFSKIYKVYNFTAKVFLYSLLIILLLVAIFFTFYFIDLFKNIKTGENKKPLFGTYIIISPSMEPTIKVEDAVVIQRKEPNDLKVGNIITFISSDPRYSGLIITHRIVGIEKSKTGDIFYRTKGDNNNTEDTALVKYDNIYGKVILKIPKIGYIQYVLTQSYGWLILVVIPCLGIIIYDILKIFKSVAKPIRKKAGSDFNELARKKNRVEYINSGKENTNNEEEKEDIEIL